MLKATMSDLMRDAPTGSVFEVTDVPRAPDMRLYDVMNDCETSGAARLLAHVMPADWPLRDEPLHGIHSKERRDDGCYVVTCWERCDAEPS